MRLLLIVTSVYHHYIKDNSSALFSMSYITQTFPRQGTLIRKSHVISVLFSRNGQNCEFKKGEWESQKSN